MFKKSERGFSLIELMVVVAIISILAAIAIPSYQDYTKRARFAEVISLTDPFKTAVTLALQHGVAASDLVNGAHGIPASPSKTSNLDSIKVENGVITATASSTEDNLTYILKPNTNGSTWSIDGTCIKAGFCEP